MIFRTYSLGELSIGGKGCYGIAASAVPYSDNLFTYLRITDINDDGTLNTKGLMSVDDEKAAQYLLKPNDIVFARTGASTGRNYFYDGTDGKFVFAGFLIKFSVDETKVNPQFIKYYCLSKKYKDWVHSFNTGSTRGNINAQTYANMPIFLPPREQQDLLVNTLSALDKKIALNTAINDNLEQQASLLYDYFFEKIPPDKSKIGILADIANISSGKRPPMKSDVMTEEINIPLVGAADVMGFTNEFNHNDKILVIGRVGTHGIVQRINFPCWTSDNTLVITSNFYEFLYQILKRIDYHSLNRGSTQPLITQGDIKKVPVMIPDEKMLVEYETIVGTLMSKYETNKIENARLSALRDTLLPKLMNGEIDVSRVEL